MTTPKKISLKAVTAPAFGIVLPAPPVLIASDHSVDYACERCSTVLLHAEEGQVQRGPDQLHEFRAAPGAASVLYLLQDSCAVPDEDSCSA
jgi:hypothetical protein